MNVLRLALAQINPVVGDIKGNSKKIMSAINEARSYQSDIVVFPELALTGYPPEDLVLKPQFISDNIIEIKRIAEQTYDITAVVGFIDRKNGKDIYNAAAVIADRRIIDTYHKIILPNYGVFDEFRYFKPGRRAPVYGMNGVRFGINICEDIWHSHGPAYSQSYAGAEVIININASPFESRKPRIREDILATRSLECCVFIAYLNTVGGQDELVFDGFSMVYDYKGRLIARAKQFEEQMMIIDIDCSDIQRHRNETGFYKGGGESISTELIRIPFKEISDRKMITAPAIEPEMNREEEIYRALVLGTYDYVRKNRFNGVVIGLSGGIDSALVATVAVDALGRENVRGLFMPSEYTSVESREDVAALAGNLGIEIIELPISGVLNSYLKLLENSFKGCKTDTTEENLQARIRGNLLMAFSNKFGWLVLTTGNKSEMSVGYATLYGDMAGGFAVIKDVLKTVVYDICKWRNTIAGFPLIPERMLWKEPTAELKPDQKDSDTLPPYPVLDKILKAYIEEEKTFDEILKLECDIECVKKVITMIDRSEYKRRQAPPGIKITSRAFGRDRRFPITNQYRSW